MGAGGSSNYKSHAEREQDRIRRQENARIRAEARRLEKEKRRIENEAREAWLRVYRSTETVHKKWWNAEWFPLYSWFKERRAWKGEQERRRRTGWTESDGILLRPHHD